MEAHWIDVSTDSEDNEHKTQENAQCFSAFREKRRDVFKKRVYIFTIPKMNKAILYQNDLCGFHL